MYASLRPCRIPLALHFAVFRAILKRTPSQRMPCGSKNRHSSRDALGHFGRFTALRHLSFSLCP